MRLQAFMTRLSVFLHTSGRVQVHQTHTDAGLTLAWCLTRSQSRPTWLLSLDLKLGKVLHVLVGHVVVHGWPDRYQE